MDVVDSIDAVCARLVGLGLGRVDEQVAGLGAAQGVANAILFLSSAQASGITGASLSVDGGLSALLAL